MKNQHLWLSAERTIYWEEEKALILADLHFGKTGHFRKSGIPVPQKVYQEDLQRLLHLIDHFRPQQILAIGDLFHSRANNELDWFRKWRESFEQVDFILIKGNHDILPPAWYPTAGIQLIDEKLVKKPFRFTHEQCEPAEEYSFCGHLHPAVVINGAGRQSLRFPCFFFGTEQAILPAFSRFTGMANIRPGQDDVVYAIVEDRLVRF